MRTKDPKGDWIKNRKELAWEPEILISGIVLIGLLQIPKLLDNLLSYVNELGPEIFYSSGIDEFTVAFLNTSVFFLITGLIINLFLRSIWVVMIGMSYNFPRGIDLSKFKFLPYFQKKISKISRFDERVIKMDQYCSLTYSLTFFVFMCVLGISFYLFTIIVFVLAVNFFIPEENTLVYNLFFDYVNVVIFGLGLFFLLDFLTMGWFKRIKYFSYIYIPLYKLMSALTLAPLYRNLYYAILSRFNRWKILGLITIFGALVFLVFIIQTNSNNLFNQSDLYISQSKSSSYDGYYRDKEAENISFWMHTPTAIISSDVMELFIAHKVGLESSIFEDFEKSSGFKKSQVIASDSLRLKAVSAFYRLILDGKLLPPLDFTPMVFSKYKQEGFIAFIEIDSLSRGKHNLELKIDYWNQSQVANMIFYKENDGKLAHVKPEQKVIQED